MGGLRIEDYQHTHACVRPAGIGTHLKKNTNAQHWDQRDPEFYGTLLNFIKFYGPPDSLL
jgi:hypothetical protein